ncbi:hypothetical protein [Devosia sp.]|uniref:hypothetical protein n=1 Tax=Devosia sp. TaxID=1871048 RepID=UPI0035B2F0B6
MLLSSAGDGRERDVWENTRALVDIPGTIAAVITTIGSPAGANWQDCVRRLQSVYAALDAFVLDEVELAAFKSLHALTNQMMIDLKDTFALVGPDPVQSRRHWSAHSALMRQEFRAMRGGARSSMQLAALCRTEGQMRYLQRMPEEIQRMLDEQPWPDRLAELLARAEVEITDFSSFYTRVDELRQVNSALNNYADQCLRSGIYELDDVIEALRSALHGVDFR